MKIKLKLFPLILLLLFVTCIPSFAGSLKQATILKISDGDTFWVLVNGKKRKLRLLGIDTPEKFESGKLDRDVARCGVSRSLMKSLGKAATAYTKRLLKKGDIVQVQFFGKGYYRRALAMVYLPDGSCYNERVVADGYAWVYTYHGRKSTKISQEEFEKLLGLMKQARDGKKGLWGTHFDLMECLSQPVP